MTMKFDQQQLAAQFGHADVAVRRAVAERLAAQPECAARLGVELVRACGDEDESVREWAVAALEDSDPPPSDVVPEMMSLVEVDRHDVGYWAATLLGRIGPEAAPAVETLAGAVTRSASQAVRERAVWALGQIGPAAASACTVLEAAAHSDSPRLARLAQRALEQIRSER